MDDAIPVLALSAASSGPSPSPSRTAANPTATAAAARDDAIPGLALSAASSGPSPSPSKTPANPATAMDDAIPVLALSAASSEPSPSSSKTPANPATAAAAAAMDDAIPLSTRLCRTTPYHDAYTVRVHDQRFEALATARPADARRWVATTRWLHGDLLHQERLIVGLGVQWTPTRLPLRGDTPAPATLQLCVGHRCLVFQLAQAGADSVPEALRRFLADPRVTFVGSGSDHDRRMLWEHYGLDVARGQELRAVARMGNASAEKMADRLLGYPGIHKPRDVAMSDWHAPRLSLDQVQYASVDAYLAFRLGHRLLCPGAGLTDESDTESEMDSYDDVYHTATRGLPVRAYASDSDYSVGSSDGFDVRFGVFTDEEDEEDDGIYSGTGSLGADDVDGNGDDDEEDEEGCDEDDQDDEEEEDCNKDDLEDEKDCNQYEENDEEGCKQGNVEGYTDEDQNDEEGYNEDDHEVQGYNYTYGAGMDGSAELVSNEVVIDGCEDDALAQGDWYDQDVYYGTDQDDEQEFEEFYLL